MPAFFTYDSTIRVEDVKDLIANVSIRKTPFTSSIGTAEADDTEHKWMTDTYAASADNAGAEGSDPTYPALTDPSKVSNITQIIRKPIQITFSKMNVRHHGMSDNWAYQKVKKTIELKKDLELAAIFGTIASGTGSAGRRMKGLISFITSYKDGSSYSGKQLSPTIFAVLGQNIWTNSDLLGGNVLVGAYQKRRISENFAGFDSNARRVIDMGLRKVEIPVDTVVSDFGTYEIQLSNDVNTVAAGTIASYQPDFHKIAYLRNSAPQAIEYAMTGLARKGEVWTEATLEVHNEATNGAIQNLATS